MTRTSLAITLMLAGAAPVSGGPLSEMAGDWRGTGWAKETPQSPQEAVRCRITNAYDTATRTLHLDGRCAVAGRTLDVSGTLTGAQGDERVTGWWQNPDGLGSARVVGLQRDGLVAFTFNATDPATGRPLSSNIEWRVTGDSLRLRAAQRSDPTEVTTDITFGH